VRKIRVVKLLTENQFRVKWELDNNIKTTDLSTKDYVNRFISDFIDYKIMFYIMKNDKN